MNATDLVGESTLGALLAVLLGCRGQQGAGRGADRSRGWGPSALVDQLAYDISLLGLAEHLGIACDVRRFDEPHLERSRLEDALAARGINLGELDVQAQSSLVSELRDVIAIYEAHNGLRRLINGPSDLLRRSDALEREVLVEIEDGPSHLSHRCVEFMDRADGFVG